MKRYAIAAVFAGWIVVTISLFLGLAAAKPLPTFRLETLEGDSKEGEALLLRGLFGNGTYNESVAITAEGSEYESEQSAYARYRDWWIPHIPELARLIDAYPGFMRGRQHFSAEYYEDDEWLIRFRAHNVLAENGQWEGVQGSTWRC